MQMNLGEEIYDVVIIKKKNKNTYIRVNDDMQIVVTTSVYSTKKFLKELLEENESSIINMIERKKEELKKNEKFLILGKEYQMIKMSTQKSVELKEPYIYVKDEKMLDIWIKKIRKQLFQERMDFIYQKFEEQIPYPKLKIRTMKTRWGVCNKRDDSVTLNSELLREPLECLDYVITHELSHFVHFDHSKEFWKLVEKYNPDYKKVRKYLKG